MAQQIQLQPLTASELAESSVGLIDDDLQPPGTSREYFEERLPTESELHTEVLKDSTGWETLPDAFESTVGSQLFEEFENSEPVKLKGIEDEQIPTSLQERFGRGGDLKKHWNQLKKYTPKDAQITFLGDQAVLTYQGFGEDTPECPNRYVQVLNFANSSKKRGIHIEQSFHPFADVVLDAHSKVQAPSRVYLKNHNLVFKLLMPLSHRGIIGSIAQGDGVYDVNVFRLDKGDYDSIVYHEAVHTEDLAEDSEVKESTSSSAANTLTRLVADISLPLGVVMALTKISPFMLYGSLIFNAVTYPFSRNPNNALGKGFHELIALELRAYAKMKMRHEILRKNGRKTKEFKYADEHAISFFASYEPFIWGLIDSFRFAAKKIRENKEAEQNDQAPVMDPAPAVQLAF